MEPNGNGKQNSFVLATLASQASPLRRHPFPDGQQAARPRVHLDCHAVVETDAELRLEGTQPQVSGGRMFGLVCLN